VVVLEHAARVDAGGLAPLGDADAAPGEVLRSADRAVGADVERPVAEDARRDGPRGQRAAVARNNSVSALL
jgi:hypothetical protein